MSAPAKEDVYSKKPSRKKLAGVVIRDPPDVSVSKKKASAKVDRGKGMDLLFDVPLLEGTQLKKALKRSKQDTHMLHASGSDDGVGSQLKVPDEIQDKTIGINEGIGTILKVPDRPKDQSESENKSWGDSGDDDDSNDDDSNDDVGDDEDDKEEEAQKDEYVHTPEDYVHTEDETNDESKEFDEEEYEELYVDVNISLKDAELADKKKEGVGNQVKDDAQVTQKIEGPIPSSSISFNYAAKYLNFDNIPPVDTEVVSMLDINVQHEVPRTSPLLTILVSVIPENTIFNPPEIDTTASSTTISSLLSSLFPHLQQLTPIPTPTTTEATTSTTSISESETLTAFHQRITNLENDVKELKTVDHSAALLSNIKSEVPNAIKEYLGTSLDDALYKVLKKHDADIIKEHSVPAEIVKRLRQQYVPEKST
ncbi:hypothetical protein Tco_1137134, partial [Tanacetum coccineum]